MKNYFGFKEKIIIANKNQNKMSNNKISKLEKTKKRLNIWNM